MKKLSSLLLLIGVALIAVSGWQLYQSNRDTQALVEIQWLTPELATVGQETPAPMLFTNRSGNAARIVGLNHC
jgi:hypothetical protein